MCLTLEKYICKTNNSVSLYNNYKLFHQEPKISSIDNMNIITFLKIYTTFGYIVSLILLNLVQKEVSPRGFGRDH